MMIRSCQAPDWSLTCSGIRNSSWNPSRLKMRCAPTCGRMSRRHDPVDPVLRREVEQLACHDRPETESLPRSGDDQTDLGDVVAPPVALEFERAVGDDLAVVFGHHPNRPALVGFEGPPLHQIAAGDVDAEVLAIFSGQGTKKLVRPLDIVGLHRPNGDGASVAQFHPLADASNDGPIDRSCCRHLSSLAVPAAFPLDDRHESPSSGWFGCLSSKMRPGALNGQESRRRIETFSTTGPEGWAPKRNVHSGRMPA